jgi:glyoxylase-like metal-dependent hydrolase (beta-lactamase superfamily II)
MPHLSRFASRARALLPVIGLAAFLSAGLASATPRPLWRVYAVRYATVPAFPVNGLVAGADSSRTMDIAMMFWLLRGPANRCVLVDAGFHRAKFLDSWKPAGYVLPSEALTPLGIAADSVRDVILTHVHWDHVDGADLFPRARIWIQREEYEYYVGPAGAPMHEGIDSLDAAMLADLHAKGRLAFVEGDGREVLPGVTAYLGGKHTYASQYLAVRTAKGTVVLASDNVYLYENLEHAVPIAQTLDAESNLAAQRRMRILASAPRLIVPGHDPAVFTRFREVAPGIAVIE